MEKSIQDIEIKETSNFFRLEEGNNICRIVSGFVPRVITFKDGTQSQKYSCWVIDRKDGQIRLADFGKTIMKQLKALAQSNEYAFTDKPGYDITINKQGSGMETSYTLTPARQDTPLTEEELKKIEKAGKLADVINKMKASSVTTEEKISVDDLPF